MANLILEQGEAWDLSKRSFYFAPIDREEIRAIPTGNQGLLDLLRWMPDKKGLFLVKSAY